MSVSIYVYVCVCGLNNSVNYIWGQARRLSIVSRAHNWKPIREKELMIDKQMKWQKTPNRTHKLSVRWYLLINLVYRNQYHLARLFLEVFSKMARKSYIYWDTVKACTKSIETRICGNYYRNKLQFIEYTRDRYTIESAVWGEPSSQRCVECVITSIKMSDFTCSWHNRQSSMYSVRSFANKHRCRL